MGSLALILHYPDTSISSLLKNTSMLSTLRYQCVSMHVLEVKVQPYV